MRFPKYVVIASVLFYLSSAIGSGLVANCTDDCKEVKCLRGVASNCARFFQASCVGSEGFYVLEGATGGTCTTLTQFVTYLAQCPSCDPQCDERPTEASDCSPWETPGCDPGVNCCGTGSEISLAICNIGTAGRR